MPTTNALRLINHFIELRIFSRSSSLQVKSLLPLKKNLPKTQWMGKLSAFVKVTLQSAARSNQPQPCPPWRSTSAASPSGWETSWAGLPPPGKNSAQDQGMVLLGVLIVIIFCLDLQSWDSNQADPPLPQSTSSSSSSSSLLAAGLAASVLMSNIPFSEEDYLL